MTLFLIIVNNHFSAYFEHSVCHKIKLTKLQKEDIFI